MGRMDYIVALIPSTGVAILFVIAMRAIILADRRERAAIREFENGENSPSSVAQRDNSETRN